MANAVRQLLEQGQSVWLDYIRRDMLDNGELVRLVQETGVRGVTSNPSIFQKAIAGSTDYDAAFVELVKNGKSADEIYEALVIEDIQRAADALRPVYDESEGADGFVSLEVSPELARDTQGTIRDAKRLWDAVDRPNLLIKIPATAEGIPAIVETLAAGVNVNVTLMFSMQDYENVAHAYLDALEKRVEAGEPIDRIASVASFFLSRVDTQVDKRLPEGSDLRGRAAVANAKVVYARYRELFAGPRWEKLASQGARPQRVLWASTSTKNPAYNDLLYVETIVGADTVNTLPPATLDAMLDHGKAARTVDTDVEGARKTLAAIVEAGIDLDAVLAQLQVDGVKAFSDAFQSLMETIRGRRETLLEEQPWAQSASA